MNKEEIQHACRKDVDNFSMVLQEKKIDLRIVSIEHLIPIIDRYIGLAYDYGSLNGQNIGRTELLNSLNNG